MENFNFKRIGLATAIGLVLIIAITLIAQSIQSIEPGNKGVVFYKWGDGLDDVTVLDEGVQIIAPWNELIVYDVRQKNVDLSMSVLDKNGLEVGIDISVLYNPMPLSIGKLHNEIGRDYESIIVVPRSRSAGREVAGEFNSEELYSSKRDLLQTNIELLLQDKFNENYISLVDVLIRDVNLPAVIKKAIENKQEQDQKNELAEKLESEATSKANATIAFAEGVKQSKILEAQGEAESIRLLQAQLNKSPEYTELIKIQGYAKTGKSWYGENNVFGDGAATVIKGLK